MKLTTDRHAIPYSDLRKASVTATAFDVKHYMFRPLKDIIRCVKHMQHNLIQLQLCILCMFGTPDDGP
jgi:hypothetical protein